MSRIIERGEVRRLVAGGAQLVEVLPREDYEAEHIAWAINVPLEELTAQSHARLDPDRPVIVHCNDFQ